MSSHQLLMIDIPERYDVLVIVFKCDDNHQFNEGSVVCLFVFKYWNPLSYT